MSALGRFHCISSHREARDIKFGHQINIIERVSLDPLPQAVVISLAHNYLKNLELQRSCYHILAVKATL